MRSKGKNEIRETSVGTIGSDNVFADLGLPDAETRLLKARLVSKIDDVIEKRGLTQAEAGRGVPEIDFNALWDRALAPTIQALGYEPVRAGQDAGALIIT